MRRVLAQVLSAFVAAAAFADDAIHIGWRGLIWDGNGGVTCVRTSNLEDNGHYDLGRNYTMSCWVREIQPKDPGGLHVVLIQGAWGCEGVRLSGYYTPTQRNLSFGTVHRVGENYESAYITVEWTGNDMGIYDENWHLLTAVFSAAEGDALGTGKLFVDGVAVASGSLHVTDFAVDAAHDFCIGGYENSNYPCGSYMADVGLWNRALSDKEVVGLYKHRVNPKDEGLVGYWPLASDTGDAVDNGAKKHNAWVFQGSWASCYFHGPGADYGNYAIPDYETWKQSQGDVPSPTIAYRSVMNVTDHTVEASCQVLDCGGDCETVDLYSVVTLAGCRQPVTNLLAEAIGVGNPTNVVIGGLLPARDYEVSLLARNPQGGVVLENAKAVSTPVSANVYQAMTADRPYVIAVENAVVGTTNATVTGRLDASGVQEGVEVVLDFGAEGIFPATVADGVWSAAVEGVTSGRSHSYVVVATAPNGLVDKVHGTDFITYGPAVFTAEVAERTDVTNVTFRVQVSVLGLGQTTFALLMGESADSLQPVEGRQAVYSETDEVSSFEFAPVAVAWNKTYCWAVRSVSVKGGAEYAEQTDVASFNTDDTTTYTWREDVADGAWDDPANWTPSSPVCCGYPDSSQCHVYVARTAPTTIRVNGRFSCVYGDGGSFASFCKAEKIVLSGDPARSDNAILARATGGLRQDQVLVIDNLTVEWWDFQPKTTGGKVVFTGRNAHVAFGGLTVLTYEDVNLSLSIPAEGYAAVPYDSTSPFGLLFGDSGTAGLPDNEHFRITVEPDSPLLRVTGQHMRVKLASGRIYEGMKANIVCTAPAKGVSSFEILDDGVYFNYYRAPGMVIVIE